MECDLSTLVTLFSKRNDGDLFITKNFQIKEFACRDGSDPIAISLLIPLICQAVRNHFKKPFTPNSAYRTPEYNARADVKGSPTSLHIYGNAVDIPASAAGNAQELYDFLDELLGDSCELIYYSWGVHVGIQNTKSRQKGSTR